MAGAHSNPTERFSSRVENYVKYRPSYPSEVIDHLIVTCGLGPSSQVADVGSGTGILSRLLMMVEANVYAVEPNREMREAAESWLSDYEWFHSVDGTAEQTGLPDGSIDIVVAAQAFHWFDREPTRREFVRILKPGGWLALIWNDRHVDTTPFLRAYENLLEKYGTDYTAVKHRNISEVDLRGFFEPGKMDVVRFPNVQVFGWEGFLGRVLSSSYVPEAGNPNHDPMLAELKAIYDEHQVEGKVSFEYTTEIFYGRLS